MSDPLSVTASVLTLVASGLAIAKGLHQIADGIGSAGEEVRSFATEISLLSRVLEGTFEQLSKKSEESRSRAEHLIVDILDACEGVLKPINEVQATLNPLLLRYKNSPAKLRQVAVRVYWFFSGKDKMQWYRKSLKFLNSLLNTTLATMKMEAADSHSDHYYIQYNSFQICVTEAQRSSSDRAQLRLDDNASASGDSATMEAMFVRRAILPGESNNPEQIGSKFKTAPQTLDEANDSEENDADVETSATSAEGAPISQALILSGLRQEELDEDLDDSDTEEIQQIEQTINDAVDRSYETSAQNITEDMMSVSRKVLRYAEEVLQASTQAVPPKQRADYSVSSATRATADEFLSIPHESVLRANRESRANHETREIHNRQAPVNVEPNMPLSVVPADLEDKGFLVFKNVDGKDYLFPYNSVRNWEDARAAWLSMKYPPLKIPHIYEFDSQRHPKTSTTPKECFDEGKFLLTTLDAGTGVHHILPQFWYGTVQPSWTIELHFDEYIYWDGKTPRAQEKAHIGPELRAPSTKLTRYFKRDYWF